MGMAWILLATLSLGQVPAPQQIAVSGGTFFIQPGVPVVVADDATDDDLACLKGLFEAVGYELPIKKALEAGTEEPGIFIGEWKRNRAFELRKIRKHLKNAETLKPEGFELTIWKKGVAIAGKDAAGTFYGVLVLAQVARAKGFAWPCLNIVDWPDLPLRGACVGGSLTTGQLKALAELRCNWIVFESDDFYDLTEVRGRVWQRVFSDARRMHIEPVPVLRTLSGAGPLLFRRPQAAEGRVFDDRLTLTGTDWAPLSRVNIIETVTCPVRVGLFPSLMACLPEQDYALEAGVLEAPFYGANTPWRIRPVAGGSILSGAKVQVTYTYAPPDSSALCPYAPETRELLGEVMGEIVRLLSPRYLHIGHGVIARLNEDQRSKAQERSRTEAFWDSVALLNSIAMEKDPKIKLMLWTDAINPYQDAPHYGLEEAAARIPRDMTIGLRLAGDDDPAFRRLPALLEWCAQSGNPFLVAVDGSPADVHSVVARVAACAGNARGVLVAGGAAMTKAFELGMEKAWSLRKPRDPWSETLNAYLGCALAEPAYPEQFAALAAHLNRETLAGRPPQDTCEAFCALAVELQEAFPKQAAELERLEHAYHNLADYLVLETTFPRGENMILRTKDLIRAQAALDPELAEERQQELLDAIQTKQAFPTSSSLFAGQVLHFEPMAIPTGSHLLEIPVKPQYDDAEDHATATLDFLAQVGKVYRIDYETVGAERLKLAHGADGEHFTPLQEWAEEERALRAPALLETPVDSRFLRLTIEAPGERAMLRAVRVFALKERPVAACPYAVETPRPGEAPKEAALTETPQATGFVRLDTPQFAEAPTEVHLCRTRTHLFVGVSAKEPRMHALVAGMLQRDQPLWRQESFEMIIVVGKAGPYRLIVNPVGAQFDSCAGDVGWDGDWQVVAEEAADQWTAVLVIPFEILGGAPARGAQWQVNFKRTRHNVEREVSAWAQDHDNPASFQLGILNFD